MNEQPKHEPIGCKLWSGFEKRVYQRKSTENVWKPFTEVVVDRDTCGCYNCRVVTLSNSGVKTGRPFKIHYKHSGNSPIVPYVLILPSAVLTEASQQAQNGGWSVYFRSLRYSREILSYDLFKRVSLLNELWICDSLVVATISTRYLVDLLLLLLLSEATPALLASEYCSLVSERERERRVMKMRVLFTPTVESCLLSVLCYSHFIRSRTTTSTSDLFTIWSVETT